MTKKRKHKHRDEAGAPPVQKAGARPPKRAGSRGRPTGPRLQFLGAAGGVTGSCTLVETPRSTFLVDCGMLQGGHEGDQLSRLMFRPREIEAVLLTHAHLDHSGLLPWLCRAGFAGPIFATPGTRDLCQILFADSARIQEEDAGYHKRHGHHSADPLYTTKDVPETMAHFVAREYNWRFEALPAAEVELFDAGHILGAASIQMTVDGAEVVFSGDVGPRGRPILRDPQPPPSAHTVITEATYGDRFHQPIEDSVEELAQAVNDLADRGGVMMMPVFAVGRTETMIYELGGLMRDGRIPEMPVFLDSPLAIEGTSVFRRHLDYYDADARALLARGIDPLTFPTFKLVRSVDQSKALNQLAGPAIIMAGSGMCTGGRIRHHLRNRLAHDRDMVVFVGYQAADTLGRILVEGVPRVKLYGEWVPVRAEIRSVEGFSAHADQHGLQRWLKSIDDVEQVLINHGEPKAAAAYAEAVAASGSPKPHVVSLYETVELG